MSTPGLARYSSFRFRIPLEALLVVAIVCVPAPVLADSQLWVLASITKSVADDWRLQLDVAPRWERDASDYSRTVMRGQLSRLVRKSVAVGVGYEFQSPASFYVRREHRTWQQVQVQQTVRGWALSQRVRLEQRWLRNVDPLVLRARYGIRAGRAFGPAGEWQWFALGELLATVRGDALAYRRGLDRHRLGAGVGRTLSPHMTVEAGYTWQAINRPFEIATQHDHLFIFNVQARY